jgi:hypothetical protein
LATLAVLKRSLEGLAMEAEANSRIARLRPRLVVDNRGEALFTRSVDTGRTRRQISVHREWNDHAEWWVGQVVANAEVYHTGRFVSPEQAFAATIAYYYEIIAEGQRDEHQDAERAARAAAMIAARMIVDPDED